MQDQSKIPVHVSIIMDGNGRWAKERGQERVFGHKNGVQSVKACVEQAGRRGVKYLSLFAFSEENWERPKDEVNTLMDMMMANVGGGTVKLLRSLLGDVLYGVPYVRKLFLGFLEGYLEFLPPFEYSAL